MIIVMAGLPGTGKSTLALTLAAQLPAVVLNKDILRAALFPVDEIDHSPQQDDFVVNLLFQAAEYFFQGDPERFIIIDGRTFSKKVQIDDLINYSKDHEREFKVIYCICSDEVARARIEHDVLSKEHLASDRDFNLYLRLKKQSDPLLVPHLTVNTGEPLESCVESCFQYL
jgi:predicted kinase